MYNDVPPLVMYHLLNSRLLRSIDHGTLLYRWNTSCIFSCFLYFSISVLQTVALVVVALGLVVLIFFYTIVTEPNRENPGDQHISGFEVLKRTLSRWMCLPQFYLVIFVFFFSFLVICIGYSSSFFHVFKTKLLKI